MTIENSIPDVIPEGTILTLRERIIQYLIAKMEGMKQLDKNGQEIGPLWQDVIRGDPDDMNLSASKAPMVLVEDGEEVTVRVYTSECVLKRITVYIHVRFAKGQLGVDPFSVFNYYLGRLQHDILSDYRLGNTCQDVNETAAAPQVFNGDKLQGGYLALAVDYRHDRSNPQTQR